MPKISPWAVGVAQGAERLLCNALNSKPVSTKKKTKISPLTKLGIQLSQLFPIYKTGT
jgi:hypothetical protein